MSLTFDIVHGRGVEPFVDDLARLRLTVFREFPYLYEGDRDYEAWYLQTYARSDRSIIVLAKDGDRVVGASTGLPLADEMPDMQAPWRDAGLDVDAVFYFGESVLLAEHRGGGTGARFFDAREAHAASLGGFTVTAFCAVDRPANHPRRPPDYRPLDAFWRRRGYQPRPDLKIHFPWKDLDEDQPTTKTLTCWMKPLA